MSETTSESTSGSSHTAPGSGGDGQDIRQQILHLIEHLEHVLPAQAAIKDFVHHNTLHGYQHLSFPEALAQSEATSGAKGYLSSEQFRKLFAEGRITRDDLESVLNEETDLELEKVIFDHSGKTICHKDIVLCTLLHSLKPVTHCQLTWQIEELEALEHFQGDLSSEQCQALIARHASQYGNDCFFALASHFNRTESESFSSAPGRYD